jgi:hypothetical protein
MAYVLQVLQKGLKDISSPQAYLILAKTMRNLVSIGKDDPLGKEIDTLAISGAETLYINEEFWDKQIRSEFDAKFVLMHELMHHVLGDTAVIRKRQQKKRTIIDNLENVATDARINALLFSFFGNEINTSNKNGNLLYRLYKPEKITGLLRPHSDYKPESAFYNLYTDLYDNPGVRGYEDILDALKVILGYKNQKIDVTFIGGHTSGTATDDGKGEGGKGVSLEEMPPEVKDAITSAMIEGAGSKTAGYGANAFDHLVELLKAQQGLDRRMLKNYATQHNINKIRSYFHTRRISRKPIPIAPTKRDLSKVATTGLFPVMWAAPKRKKSTADFSVAIYLDVSGSVHDVLPKILRLLNSMKKEIQTVYCFSNEVHDHSLQMLRRGEIKTTGGTDFDCVADHLEEQGFKRCIIITDGYAGIDNNRARKMLKQLDKVGIVLFEKSDNRNNWFSQQFDTFYLDEVVN